MIQSANTIKSDCKVHCQAGGIDEVAFDWWALNKGGTSAPDDDNSDDDNDYMVLRIMIM